LKNGLFLSKEYARSKIMLTKQEILEKLSRREVKVRVNFNNDKDENFLKYSTGDITLRQFIENITEESPYTISETFENNFIIHDKRQIIPINYHLNPKLMPNLLSEENKETIIKVYPELESSINKVYTEINSAECTSCARNAKTQQVIRDILSLDNSDRDLTELNKILGKNFVEKLKISKPELNRQPLPSTRRSPIISEMQKNNAVRPPCVNCCIKHLGTAISQLGEARNGYPSHRGLAVGELNEAAAEIFGLDENVAKQIREIRHLISENEDNDNKVYEMLNEVYKQYKAV